MLKRYKERILMRRKTEQKKSGQGKREQGKPEQKTLEQIISEQIKSENQRFMRETDIKKTVKWLVVSMLSLVFLCGCQAQPEASESGDAAHAKSSYEEDIEAITDQGTDGEEADTGNDGMAGSGAKDSSKADSGTAGKGASLTTGESLHLTVGEGENCMVIEAELPALPETAPVLTMQADSRLNQDVLEQFLEPQGEVRDITQEKAEEAEAENERHIKAYMEAGMTEEEARATIVTIANIGDDSFLALTDGNRTASLYGCVTLEYEDADRMEQFRAVASGQEAKSTDDIGEDVSFPMEEAEKLLLQKLSFLGIKGIFPDRVNKGYYYEGDGCSFYELNFTPVYDGIGTACAFSGIDAREEIRPEGYAFVSPEGVAKLSLRNCCMEVAAKEDQGKLLGWNQVQELLEVYLKNGELQCRDILPFRYIEFVYYPVYDGAELKLIPTWNIHMDFEEYCGYTEDGIWDTCWSIYINAVTGGIERVC